MIAKMIKTVVTATALFTGLLGASANAAPWTFTTTGTISSGYDYAGVFGLGENLTGMNYVLSTVVDPKAYQYQYAYAQVQSSYGSNTSPITQKVSIGSVTKTYQLNLNVYNWGQSYMYSDSGFTQAYQNFDGVLANGNSISGTHAVYTYSQSFLDSISYTQNLSYQPTGSDYGYANFSMTDIMGYTSMYFDGNKPTTLTINNLTAAPADVPEPASLAMLGLGLISFAIARRKKA